MLKINELFEVVFKAPFTYEDGDMPKEGFKVHTKQELNMLELQVITDWCRENDFDFKVKRSGNGMRFKFQPIVFEDLAGKMMFEVSEEGGVL